jgi:hypothetical protein
MLKPLEGCFFKAVKSGKGLQAGRNSPPVVNSQARGFDLLHRRENPPYGFNRSRRASRSRISPPPETYPKAPRIQPGICTPRNVILGTKTTQVSSLSS